MIKVLKDYYFHPNIKIVSGKSKDKVDAINRDIELVKDWDFLCCMSDDMVFNVKGFDEIIRDAFNSGVMCFDIPQTKKYNLDQFIHFPDGNRKDLCTMSIIGMTYYERDKYIYNPEYASLYCDNEAQEVAKIRGCYKYVDTQIFEHLHPAYGKAVFDSQYQHTESFGTIDAQTYQRRKENNYGL